MAAPGRVRVRKAWPAVGDDDPGPASGPGGGADRERGAIGRVREDVLEQDVDARGEILLGDPDREAERRNLDAHPPLLVLGKRAPVGRAVAHHDGGVAGRA